MKQKLLILIAALLAAVNVHAYDFEVDSIFYNKLSSTEVEVVQKPTGYGYEGKIDIPSTVFYEGTVYSVTSIGESAFRYSGIRLVTIPNSVTSIGDQAFNYCHMLYYMDIPNSVTSIGAGAFSACMSLVEVTIGDSVISIGEAAFAGCMSLASVTIPNSVTSIGAGAFSACMSLVEVTIGDSVISIGEGAFDGCQGLVSVAIPNSVEEIGNLAFRGCINLSAFYGKYASEDNRCLISSTGELIAFAPQGLTSSYSIPSSVTSIGEWVLTYTGDLASLIIGDSVTYIGEYAFNYNRGLTSVTIGDSVEYIGNAAFAGCTSLATVTIGDSVEYISEGTFNGCTSLATVNLGNSVRWIGERAFYECRSLASVTIPNSVGSIGEFAFYSCRSLASVILGNSVRDIGRYAFEDCKFSELWVSWDTPTVVLLHEHSFPLSYKEATLYVPFGTLENYNASPWANFKEIKEYMPGASGVVSVEDNKAVMIKTVGNSIQICGSELGKSVQLYDTKGRLLDSTIAGMAETRLGHNLQHGQIYIIRYGNESIKFRY